MDYSIKNILLSSLNWAEKNKYSGYSKFDALNSPILKRLSGDNYYVKAGFIYLVSRSPINIRPILYVKKKQNPKGIALFSRSYFNLFSFTGDKIYLNKGLQLIEELISISQIESYTGHCWGYDHPWQNKSFYAPEYFPNTVVTMNVAEALLDAYDYTLNNKYLKIAEKITSFVQNDLTTIIDTDKYLCSSYVPENNWKVINVNALLASFYVRLYSITKNDVYLNLSKRYINWVVSTQTDYGAWYYTDPAHKSPITHDNYHTGFILDAIYDYMDKTDDNDYKYSYESGLDFYEKNLFTEYYAPKWMYNKKFPHDIHGVAQGIITFCKASKYKSHYLSIAANITNWGLMHLYNHNESRFLYQKGKYWNKSFTLMRWCQSWMCYALSIFLKKKVN